MVEKKGKRKEREGGQANFISISEAHPKWVDAKSPKTKKDTNEHLPRYLHFGYILHFTFYFFYSKCGFDFPGYSLYL